MTQPLAINQTFDTSLVDVQRSFSSTETNTSGSSGKENVRPSIEALSVKPTTSVQTDELYDQWAATYDTDGNVLQAVDDIQVQTMLPDLVSSTIRGRQGDSQRSSQALRLLDFGCGTGKNTLKLLKAPWDQDVDIVGWDGSRAMLEIATKKCDTATRSQSSELGLEFEQMDFSNAESVPERYRDSFNGVISTLVLEHIQADTFFGILAKVLKSGCHALVTNMHPDMGAVSRAGYKTTSGERVKVVSYNHTVHSTINAARKAGLEIRGWVHEVAVDETMVSEIESSAVGPTKAVVRQRAQKWLGTRVWYGLMFRKQ